MSDERKLQNPTPGQLGHPMSRAEIILEKHISTVAGLKDLTQWHRSFILAAMQDMGSIAFEAGRECEYCREFPVPAPNQQQFLDSLFKEK